MRALANIRWQRQTWQICPWMSLRSSAISLIVVAFVAVVFDHWILASLERRGLVAADSWKRHNRVVVANHQRKDRHLPVPLPKGSISTGVRAWVGHPVTRERAKPHRILVMGDSYVWDSPYLTLNHMWWRQLEIELRRRGYHDVEVIAAGRAGLSTHEELNLARKVVPDFLPDLIVWGFVTNDPDERLVKQINTSQLASPIPGRVQALLQHVTPRLLDLFHSRRNDKLAKSYLGPEYGYEYADWLTRIHDGETFRQYRQTVEDVSHFLHETNIPGIMVTLPEAPIAERFAFSYDKVLPLWRDTGIPVYDHLPALLRKFPDTEATGPKALLWGINPADGHPGPRSTAFLAQQTADCLERDYPQFLGPKSSEPDAVRINDWLPFDLDLNPLQGKDRTGIFEITYPATDTLMPTMPLGLATALVALEQPVPLREIRLSGTGLKSAQVWLSTYDPVEHYDTEEWRSLESQQGRSLTWIVPDDLSIREASVILLRAEVAPDDRRLQLELHTCDRPVASQEGSR